MFPDHGFGPPPLFKFVFFGIFALAVFRILASLIGKATDHAENSAAPLLSSRAAIRAKRTEIRGGRETAQTRYFVTFEQSDGTRREFPVTGEQFGQWVEGDTGTLYFQGDWFQGFERGGGPPTPAERPVPETVPCAYCATPLRSDAVECPNCGSTRRV